MQNVSSSNSQAVNVPKLRFPGFESEWEREKLRDFTERVVRKNKENETKLPLTISSKDGLVDQITYFNKQVSSKDMSGYYLLKKGEFAYNKSYSVGFDFGSIKRLDRYPMGALSTLYICFAIKKHNSDFMKTYFDSLKWYKEIYMIAAEGARNHGLLNVPTEDFFDTTHILPQSETEQKKIAKFLLLLDERITKQEQLVDSLKLYKRGAFLELYRKSQKNKYTFSDIYETASEGGTPSTSIAEYYEKGDIPFIKIDDLSGRYVTTAKNFITQRGLEKSSAWLIPANSLIFSNGATIGACSINKIPIATKQGILGIVPKDNISVSFLYYYMTSSIFMKKIKAITTKGTMDCAYLKDISTIHIELPDFNTQIQIAEILDALSSHVEKQEGILSNLLKSKQALLQQMFI
mgnify:CR=1 FL=1